MEMDKFTLVKRHQIKDIEGFDTFSMQFHFKHIASSAVDPQTLIFAKQDKIFEFNYDTGHMRDICVFDVPLQR